MDFENHLSEDELYTIRRLKAIHGSIRIAVERSGIQLYMASPEALTRDGSKELKGMHLTLNLKKAMQGKHVNCALCMKYGASYDLDTLLDMPSLIARKFTDSENKLMGTIADNVELKPAGEMIFLNELLSDDFELHPLRVYLDYRKYTNLARMYHHMKVGFCTKATHDYNKGYKLDGGFWITPQNRIIFHAMEYDEMTGWQARYLDMVQDGVKYIYHPKQNAWIGVAKKSALGDFIPIEGMENVTERLARFYIPPGSRPSQTLLGFDAAISFNKDLKTRWVGIVEGPFDALRVGPPFCAVMGKRFNNDRAEKLYREQIDLVVVVQDDDAQKGKSNIAGDNLFKEVQRFCSPRNIRCIQVPLPKGVGDLGEADEKKAVDLINYALKIHGVQEAGLLNPEKPWPLTN